MTANEYIDKQYNEGSLYDYDKIWRLHSGKKYKLLNWYQKSIWRESVKNMAEFSEPLLSPNYYLGL